MCEIDAECSGEAFCQLATGDGGSPSCYGTCVARVGAGQGCINLQCAAPPPPALGWPICSNGGTCTVTTVMAPAAEGQPCATSTPAATITPCADDLWCDTSRLVCTASAPLGGACGTVAACASGSCKPYCLDGNCVSGTCSAYTVRRTAGQPCDDATVLCDTFASLMCVGGTCTTVDGSTGSACSPVPWYEATVCASRHSCGASRQCGATGGQSTGQACSQDDDCAGGICEFRRRACIPALCSAT
jgi:hypothetical protein